MTESNDATISFSLRPVKCPRCGTYCAPDASACEKCGGTLTSQVVQPISTLPIDRTPRGIVTTTQGQIEFLADYTVVLQILPSGVCLQTSLEKPVILGRRISAAPAEELLNLESFNANQHGISRRHCLLARQENRLTLTDLGSTNGTYLNGSRITPQKSYFVAHGDPLILGTLHITVFFSTIKG